uniref:AlNc14C33G2999 protein n=1 Tax=Albugo laibachii Nc14 TaxID=890382 RepID=F0W8A5_9STRA|nr:AlNc14C33G2999 [Albugo laibachii Nc14]|eukprot:CCA17305.1 AlNc14C33G2999 [Albugo laibachii Nc14]
MDRMGWCQDWLYYRLALSPLFCGCNSLINYGGDVSSSMSAQTWLPGLYPHVSQMNEIPDGGVLESSKLKMDMHGLHKICSLTIKKRVWDTWESLKPSHALERRVDYLVQLP